MKKWKKDEAGKQCFGIEWKEIEYLTYFIDIDVSAGYSILMNIKSIKS